MPTVRCYPCMYIAHCRTTRPARRFTEKAYYLAQQAQGILACWACRRSHQGDRRAHIVQVSRGDCRGSGRRSVKGQGRSRGCCRCAWCRRRAALTTGYSPSTHSANPRLPPSTPAPAVLASNPRTGQGRGRQGRQGAYRKATHRPAHRIRTRPGPCLARGAFQGRC